MFSGNAKLVGSVAGSVAERRGSVARRPFLQHSVRELDGGENCIAHAVPHSVPSWFGMCLMVVLYTEHEL